ncbi:endonuclease domain-containing protein [Rhodanobacter thiooxydans]|uniref:endonuclease domain-containing protein n=1 Tax=Rhodanobacter thiooxydans TaxID=416169 RepID=UPI000D3321DC|nr:endonuclease domain-containing protein [Rhodanobacter thiooxydans]
MHHKPPLPTQTLATAKSLRATSTDAERKLWYYLRAHRLGGFKFRRQHPIPPYVADFYCDGLKLVIELDGSQHSEEIDSTRMQALERQGLLVLRFWNNQVLQEIEAVLEAILNFARHRTLSPTPPPEWEGL